MIHLKGKKALITGASRGIGRATAILFAKAGGDVAITYDTHRKAAEEVKNEIEKIGRECLVYKINFSQEGEIRRLVEKIISHWQQIDILVNNVGIWTYGEIGNMDNKTWSETIKVNLDSAFCTCNEVVPIMKEKRRGCIVNVSSTAGVRGEAFHSHYAASKGGLISFTKSLAVELAPYQIRVNCVAPGWVNTDMCAEVFSHPHFKKRVKESIPLKRIASAEDIAGPILFLASDLARHITGEVLNVNGGSVLCA